VQSGTLLIAQSKSGKARRVPLTEEGKGLFAGLAAGMLEDELLITKANGSAWGKSEQDTRMVEKHYAHLAPNYIHDAIRANLPKFGVDPSVKVPKQRTRRIRTPPEPTWPASKEPGRPS
jgi:hypothetical protein